MINAGANVNIGVEQGMPTPLFVACHTNMDSPGGNLSAKVVSLLMKAGVIHDNNGYAFLSFLLSSVYSHQTTASQLNAYERLSPGIVGFLFMWRSSKENQAC
jgi:hypothetical protein